MQGSGRAHIDMLPLRTGKNRAQGFPGGLPEAKNTPHAGRFYLFKRQGTGVCFLNAKIFSKSTRFTDKTNHQRTFGSTETLVSEQFY
jgi:hypothetical protein